MATSNTKAIFVGINYGDKIFGCQDLQGLPYVYAKSMIESLTTREKVYEKNECLLFTDSEKNVPGVTKEEPSKGKVTEAIVSMISNAKKGDALLFYFCGHGANDTVRSKGAIKTLNATLTAVDCLFSNELDQIVEKLSPDISITWLIHACFGGAMFSYHPELTKGVAMTSVGPDIPSSVTKDPGAEKDFTTYIRDDVIKKFSENRPTCQKVFDGVKQIIVKGVTPSGQPFEGHADMYNAPQIDPSKVIFLGPY